MKEESRKPEKVFRGGGAGVVVSVFCNKGEHGPYFSVSVRRRYKDEGGEWRTSNHFTYPKQVRFLESALRQALAYMEEQKEGVLAEEGKKEVARSK